MSNPIPDILEELAINHDHRNCKPDCVAGEVYRESMQALYEAVKSCAPKKKTYTEATDTADHWGMTDSSIARQIDNMKGLGHNEAVDEFLANLRALFGVEDVGNLAKPEATSSQPQLADSPSAITTATPRKPDETDCEKGIHRPCYCAGRAECHDCGRPL